MGITTNAKSVQDLEEALILKVPVTTIVVCFVFCRLL